MAHDPDSLHQPGLNPGGVLTMYRRIFMKRLRQIIRRWQKYRRHADWLELQRLAR
jgi:hypothetical protein